MPGEYVDASGAPLGNSNGGSTGLGVSSTSLQDQSNSLLGGLLAAVNPTPGAPGVSTVSMPPSSKFARTWTTYDVKNWDSVFRPYFRVFDPVNPTNNASGYAEFLDMTAGTYFFDVMPSEIVVSTPFAISLVATNKGVLSEHNGIVFSTVSIRGCTGVLPSRDTSISPPATGLLNIVSQLFPATVGAVGNLINSVNKVASDIGGNSNSNPLAYPSNQLPPSKLNKTGYAKAGELKNFLTGYAQIKTQDQLGTLRLAFGTPKENVEYVCEPMDLQIKKTAGKPLSYDYEIVLKSWAIQTPNAKFTKPVTVTLPTPANANIIKQIVSTLSDARNVVTTAQSVIQGVQTDIASVMQIYSGSLLVVKSIGGLVATIQDFPAFFSNNLSGLAPPFSTAIAAAWAAGQASTGVTPPPSIGYASQPATENSATSSVSIGPTGAPVLAAQTGAPNGIGGESPALSQSFVASQQKALLIATLANPDIASAVSPDQVSLPAPLASGLNDALAAALATPPDVVRALIVDLQNTSDNYAQSVGAMDPTYAEVQGLPAPIVGRPVTAQDIINMAALQDAKTQFTYLLSSGEIFLTDKQPDPFVGANADLQESDQVPSPLSWYAGLVLQGDDLEALSARYLGDFSRWRELAILNSLRAPYIDEDGNSIAIVSASGDSVVVATVDDSTGETAIAIGQSVRVQQASGAVGAPRRILNIAPLGVNFQVTLSGTPNLTNPPGQSLWARAPGCLGSGDTIMIPVPIAPDVDNPPDRETPLQDAMSIAEQAFKVDIQLDPITSDFVPEPGGDLAPSYGYGNAQQALGLIVTVEQGELEWATGFGLPIKIGGRNSDIDPSAAQTAIASQVSSDPRFSLASATVQLDGSQVGVSIVAGGRPGTGLIPVTFTVGLAPT